MLVGGLRGRDGWCEKRWDDEVEMGRFTEGT